MDRQTLATRIKRIGDDIRRLGQDVEMLQCVDIATHPESYADISQGVAIRGEWIVRKLRGLVWDTTRVQREQYLTQVADVLNIAIHEEGDTIEITMPALIPKRRGKSTGFITEPLFAALSGYMDRRFEQELKPFQKFRHCVICITHIYEGSMPAKRRMRDYDNVELKGIIDTLNIFLLTDDSGQFCDFYQTSEIGDADLTHITIMGKDVFPRWVEGRMEPQPKYVFPISTLNQYHK